MIRVEGLEEKRRGAAGMVATMAHPSFPAPERVGEIADPNGKVARLAAVHYPGCLRAQIVFVD